MWLGNHRVATGEQNVEVPLRSGFHPCLHGGEPGRSCIADARAFSYGEASFVLTHLQLKFHAVSCCLLSLVVEFIRRWRCGEA